MLLALFVFRVLVCGAFSAEGVFEKQAAGSRHFIGTLSQNGYGRKLVMAQECP